MIKFLKSPLCVFISIALGVVIGLYLKELVPFLDIISAVYLSLLSIVVTPFILCNIVVNIEKVFNRRNILKRLILLSSSVLILVAIIGVGVLNLFENEWATENSQVSSIDATDLKNINQDFEVTKALEKTFLGNIFKKDSETNPAYSSIFDYLIRNNIVRILVCISLGVALSYLDKKISAPVINFFEFLYKVFGRLVSGLMVLTPVFLLSVIAEVAADKEMINLFFSLTGLIIVTVVFMSVVILASLISISISTKENLGCILKSTKNTIITAISTASGAAATVVCIEESQRLGIDKEAVESLLPLSTSLIAPGVLIQAIAVSFYAVFINGIAIDFRVMVIIALGSILFSIANAKTPTRTAMTALGIVLTPVGVPIEMASMVYFVLSMFCKRLKVFCKVYSNLAVIAAIDRDTKKGSV